MTLSKEGPGEGKACLWNSHFVSNTVLGANNPLSDCTVGSDILSSICTRKLRLTEGKPTGPETEAESSHLSRPLPHATFAF